MLAPRVATRATEASHVRHEAADLAARRPHPNHVNNGEEADYRKPNNQLSYAANYSKALPHNRFGEVIGDAYRALLRAMHGGDPDAFERIPMGRVGGLNLTNPQAGLAFDLEGPDAHAVTQPPAPRIDGREAAAEMGELYWMALLRDVCFTEYGTGAGTDDNGAGGSKTADAAMSLNPPPLGDFRAFSGPVDPVASQVTADTLFRGFTPGDLAGPYLSQFLLIGNADPPPPMGVGLQPQQGFIKYGTLLIDQRQRTVLGVLPPGTVGGADFLTAYERPDAPPIPGQPPATPPTWLDVQNGHALFFDPGAGAAVNVLDLNAFDPQRRFIRNLRDLANYVHFDALYEAYLNACLILLSLPAPFDPGNPYTDSRTQDGFGTFGPPHILSLVTEVATRALKAVWFQKWGVHRRLRPEEFGGRIHVHLKGLPPRANPPYAGHLGVAANIRFPMINNEILALTGPGQLLELARLYNLNNFGDDTYLLPQVFPEGAPTHPAYGAGHATVAGACVTILKAWFDESFVLPDPIVEPACDGLGLNVLPAGAERLTVGGELDKLAANIALGRNAGGVHWRSDYTESLRLGEEIAIGILQEQRLTYNERHHSFTLTKFDGNAITI
ncbi:MAG: vanadium-dependent haloperoxidase [Chloroflexota bacterium]|nr:vanadium-dependent haloperoxidase [Chloroflexota bacterium]